jgi:hypothetical protein
MTTLHNDSRLATADPNIPRFLGTALNRLSSFFRAWRAQRTTSRASQARRDSVPDDIRLMRAKIDLELLRLCWL